MSFCVNRVAGGGANLQFREGRTLRLGRGTRADVRFNDVSVDLEHAVIEEDEQGWTIRDLGSVTGTFVDGERVGEARLANGQEIGIGQHRIGVEITMREAPVFLVVRAVADAATMVSKTLRASSSELLDSAAGRALDDSKTLVLSPGDLARTLLVRPDDDARTVLATPLASPSSTGSMASATILTTLPSRALPSTILPSPTRTSPGGMSITGTSSTGTSSTTTTALPVAGPTPVPAGAATTGPGIDYDRAYRLKRGPLRKSGFVALTLLLMAGAGAALYEQGRLDLFSPGPVTGVHHDATRNTCSACHAGWRPVDGSTCQSSNCHAAVDEHQTTLAEPQPCLDCHTEHGDFQDLKLLGKGGCTECHQALDRTLADPSALRFSPTITGFVEGDHPPFTSRDDPGALAFHHAWHLEKLPRVKLECASCHQTGEDGEILPIRFEAHCRRCHNLGFDGRRFGSQEAPHVSPGEVLTWMAGFYSLRPEVLRALTARERRRLGGRSLSQEEQLTEVARENAGALVRNKCSKCHTLEPGPPGTGRRVEQVEARPPRLRDLWFEYSIFRHAPHLGPGTPCEACHTAAAASRQASDVLLPEIVACQSCHRPALPGDEPGSLGRIDCIVCHTYHPEPRELRDRPPPGGDTQ